MVGRTNWLFSQTPHGAHASATIYSVIETAKINGLDSYAYLLDVLKNLPAATTDVAVTALLPWNQGESVYALKPAGWMQFVERSRTFHASDCLRGRGPC